ncbi:translation initiation factor 4A [Enteropsectra breve]|nr:translation initiation factor 4A [Enteropsectra breve]
MSENDKPRKVVFNDEDEEAEVCNTNEATGTNHKWESLNLKPELVKGIYSVGFEHPSFIQKKAIPTIAKGQHLRAQAQSGTGKTGAFVIGALQRIDTSRQETQCLVLVSTREIATQNADKFKEIGSFMNVNVALLAGGSSTQRDRASLTDAQPHVIVGTPGRVSHMIKEGHINVSAINIFILDEADEMLKAGFQEQVKEIFVTLNVQGLQVCFFSATYGEEELKVVENIVSSPVVIDLRNEDQTLQGIKQYFVDLGDVNIRSYNSREYDEVVEAKVDTFIDIYKNCSVAQAMLFINRKKDASLVHRLLQAKGYPCELISGELTVEERAATLTEFKRGNKRILVTSGLCKRGIDVQALSLVVCFDVPSFEDKSDFIHRVGRSGRYGRKGLALHILTKNETENLQNIAKHFHCVIPALPSGFNFKE